MNDGEDLRALELQFGHGTEPWRNFGEMEGSLSGLQGLQFGHGTEPWRNPTVEPRSAASNENFNSATARSRGETLAGGV